MTNHAGSSGSDEDGRPTPDVPLLNGDSIDLVRIGVTALITGLYVLYMMFNSTTYSAAALIFNSAVRGIALYVLFGQLRAWMRSRSERQGS